MKIQVLKQSGSEDSKIDFPQSIFVENYNFDLVQQFVSTYINNSHQNTKGQKNRSSVRGGGRKPWKQKGTGRARAGTIRSPIWRSGGVTFAHVFKPVKTKKMNKKMYRIAIKSIVSRLYKEDRLLILSDLQIGDTPKTSEVEKILSNLGLSSAVFILSEKDNKLERASCNLHKVQVQTINSLDPTSLIKAEKIILTSKTFESLTKILSK